MSYFNYLVTCIACNFIPNLKYKNGLASPAEYIILDGVHYHHWGIDKISEKIKDKEYIKTIKNISFEVKNIKKIKALCKNLTKEEETKRLLKIASDNLLHFQHLRIKAKEDDKWMIDDQIILWSDRASKCKITLGYYKRLRKVKKDEEKGIISKKPIEYDIHRLKETPIIDIVKFYGYKVKMVGMNRRYIKIRNEKTPSCCIDLDKNIYHDFGSTEHGDVIDFVAKRENCGFQEACKKLQLMGY